MNRCPDCGAPVPSGHTRCKPCAEKRVDSLSIPCEMCGDEITYTREEYMPKGVTRFTDCIKHMDEDELEAEIIRLRRLLSNIPR